MMTLRFTVIREICLFAASLVIFVALGCASTSEIPSTPPPPHPHDYPFTKVIGDHYHLRLVVDHHKGEMALIFEDISEEPAKPIRLQKIMGKAILPHGRATEVRFRAQYRTQRARFKKRKVGYFSARAEWIRTTPKFDLQVAVPFKGEVYELTFNYEFPGGQDPLRRE